MPVYNGEKFIREAIDSILAQTFRDFEFIIVDDGSYDDSQTIINEYDDNRIKYFRIIHVGIPKAQNYGLKLSKYDIVAIMNQDDICYPNRFERQIEIFRKNNEIGIVGSNYTEKYDSRKNVEIILPEKHNEIIKILPLNCCFGHPTIMMKKEILLEVGGYDEKLLIANDWDLYLRLYNKTKFYNIQSNLMIIRKHSTNASNMEDQLQMERKILLSKFYNDSMHNKNSNQNLAEIANFSKGYFLYYSDGIKESTIYFKNALKYKKLYPRYIRYYVFSKYLYKLVVISRKYELYKKLNFFRNIDKQNVFFK